MTEPTKDAISYVWLNKGYGGHSVHKGKLVPGYWKSTGTDAMLPQCGVRIDVCALEDGPYDPGGPYCKRCFPGQA